MLNRGEVLVRFVNITEDADGQRLDNFLFRVCSDVPKSRIYNAIRRGEVRINKGRCKPSNKLKLEDVVRIPPFSGKSAVDAEAGPGNTSPAERFVAGRIAADALTDIVFEDELLLIINKPSGIAVHGGSGLQTGLIESLRLVRQSDHFLELVHRLDRETSGLLLIAKKRRALLRLQSMLQEGRVEKIYHAWVAGQWPKHVTEITAPLKKLVGQDKGVIVASDGKASQTLFSVIGRTEHATLVEARPVTGRTHQIRVHAAYAGCPVIGDERYGDRTVNRRFSEQNVRRLCLHAAELVLKWDDSPHQRLRAQWNPEPGLHLPVQTPEKSDIDYGND
ncbi:MAG: 23S rRNA pseudouridine(955/2504/2580) synthase [unclassified Hahellaceae]|nr:23S rRNA pseudouridine(955/2504/2580) synthase [Hahellaceae bacterium]|tara:strand:- start:9230 stop:10231 length:1002 start_codon:yes stop_codon:yes gene_type:complete